LSIFGITYLVLLLAFLFDLLVIESFVGMVLFSFVLVALFFIEGILYLAKLQVEEANVKLRRYRH